MRAARASAAHTRAPSIDAVHVREVEADMVDLVGVVLGRALLAVPRGARVDAQRHAVGPLAHAEDHGQVPVHIQLARVCVVRHLVLPRATGGAWEGRERGWERGVGEGGGRGVRGAWEGGARWARGGRAGGGWCVGGRRLVRAAPAAARAL